jgi:hypothetical protein
MTPTRKYLNKSAAAEPNFITITLSLLFVALLLGLLIWGNIEVWSNIF